MTRHPHEPKPLNPPLAPGARIHRAPVPTGAAACQRSTRFIYKCDVCHVRPQTMHSPILADGVYCGGCCPNCNPPEE